MAIHVWTWPAILFLVSSSSCEEVVCYNCGVENVTKCPYELHMFHEVNMTECTGSLCALAESQSHIYRAWCINDSKTPFEWPPDFLGTICFCHEPLCNSAFSLRRLPDRRNQHRKEYYLKLREAKWKYQDHHHHNINRKLHVPLNQQRNGCLTDVKRYDHMTHLYHHHHRHRRRSLYSAEFFSSKLLSFYITLLRLKNDMRDGFHDAMRMAKYLVTSFPDYILISFISRTLISLRTGTVGVVT